MQKITFAIAALAATVAATLAAGAVIEIVPVADNSIYREAPGNSNGRGSLFAGNTANGVTHTRRALLRFDLSALPSGAIIESAELRMFLAQENTGAGPLPVSLHRVTEAWGEAGSLGSGGGAPAQAGDATWTAAFFGSTPWATPGGSFVAEDSAVTPVGAEGQFYAWSSTALAADVQAWFDGAAGNFGWIVRGDESAVRTAKRFESRESSNAARRPTLTVTYVIPEPASLGLLGLGGLALRRRR